MGMMTAVNDGGAYCQLYIEWNLVGWFGGQKGTHCHQNGETLGQLAMVVVVVDERKRTKPFCSSVFLHSSQPCPCPLLMIVKRCVLHFYYHVLSVESY